MSVDSGPGHLRLPRPVLRPIRKRAQPRLPAKRYAQVTRIVEPRLLRHLADRDFALRQQVFRARDSLLHDLPVRRVPEQRLELLLQARPRHRHRP